MRLGLAEGGGETVVDDGWLFAHDDGRIHVHLSRVEVAPLDMAAWMAETLKRAVPDAAELRVLGSTSGTSDRGWPVTLVDTLVARGHEVLEHRVLAIYEMLGHVGVVRVSVRDETQYAHSLKSQILPLAVSAWPDWKSRSPVALDELFSMEITPSNT